MAYLYETHLHTVQSSLCGQTAGCDYVAYYQDMGFTGIFVTDHFFRGNTRIPRELAWENWVGEFRRGYDDAREEGERRGFSVFFGWEEAFEGDEYLIYGLEPEWLLDHPEMRTWTRKRQFDEVDNAGGCVVQAHPFREREYISKIRLSAGCVHGVEAANAGNEPEFDALAYRYAQRLSLPMTAGSDIHAAASPREEIFAVSFQEKLTCGRDYAQRIRAKGKIGLMIPPGRCVWTGEESVSLPVEMRDARDLTAPRDILEFLR